MLTASINKQKETEAYWAINESTEEAGFKETIGDNQPGQWSGKEDSTKAIVSQISDGSIETGQKGRGTSYVHDSSLSKSS